MTLTFGTGISKEMVGVESMEKNGIMVHQEQTQMTTN
jgi:hypothetical protein